LIKLLVGFWATNVILIDKKNTVKQCFIFLKNLVQIRDKFGKKMVKKGV